MSILNRKKVDKIPLAAYSFLLPRGEVERKLREKGCFIFHFERVYALEMKNVEIWQKEGLEKGRKCILRRFCTPVGNLEEKILVDPGYKSQWIKEFLIKKSQDYEIMKFIVENTIYYPNYEFFQQAAEDLGDDGILFATIDRAPFQRILYELAGPERLLVDVLESPDLVEGLLEILDKKMEEVYQIVADSPASMVHTWDNVTEDMTPPALFQRYCLPFYQKVGKLLHDRGKIYLVHMDGKLRHLEDLIASAPIDVVESFTLPDAGGNLEVEEAQKKWPEKTIIANIPAYLCFKEEEFIKRYFEELISKVERNRFMVCLSEDLPHDSWKKALIPISDVLNSL